MVCRHSMIPHDRILAVLNRRPHDRTPVDIWLSPEVLADAKRHFRCEDELEVYRKLGLDKIVMVFPGFGSEDVDPDKGTGRTLWGVETRTVLAGKATYQEFMNPPFAAMTEWAELEAYDRWPNPDRIDYAGSLALARRAREFGFSTIGPWISVFEIYCQLRGLENAMMDLIDAPDFLEPALDRIQRIQSDILERLLREANGLLDLVFISDDMASQEGMLISLPTWRRLFDARLRHWCDLVHRHGAKVLYHTDGAAFDLVPSLLDAGIDVLNPIQHVCKGMDRSRLKDVFGDRVIFHGGVENQSILPFGTTDDVRAEVKRCLETLGRKGGYICSSCHFVQAGTPLDNVFALIETVHQHGAIGL